MEEADGGRVAADVKKPALRWVLNRGFRLVANARRRERLRQRLMEQTRNREVFAANNTYLMMKLRPRG